MTPSAGTLRRVHDDLCGAMVMGDIVELEDLLAGGFTLTHMTGYIQPKAEWLADIDTNQMEYHSIETVESAVDTHGAAPTLTARTITDATIWGGRGTWRLQLLSWFEQRDDRWVITRTVASTW